MSVSKQFAAIGLQQKPRKKRTQQQAAVIITKAPPAKKQAGFQGRQIPRGFVSPLAADSKFIELTTDATKTMDTTGTVTHLDIVAQGDTVSSRTGKSWINTNFQIRGTITAGTAGIASLVSAFLVWDRQPNKALAAIGDFLETSGAISSTAFAKRENKGRFLCIKKWVRSIVGNSTAAAAGREQIAIDKWIKLPQECISQCTAADTTGVIGNRITGALLLITAGDKAAGTTAPNFVYRYRIGFKDPQ